MTLEKLLENTDDQDLLNIFVELESGKIPSTSYAHEFCRKANRMVDEGDLQVGSNGYRHVYLPTIAKAVYAEMASRYATYLRNYKAPETEEAEDGAECTCAWCELEFEADQLIPTDLGLLCDRCIAAIRSRGEQVIEYA